MKTNLMTLKNLLYVSFIIISTLQLNSQELKRKGTFGALMEPTKSNVGIHVIKVIENSTASSIGLKNDDIILRVNDKEYNDLNLLINNIDSWLVGSLIQVKVKRKNNHLTLKGAVVGKPYETSEYGEIIYGQVNYDGGMLRSILTLPSGVKNPPVLFFLPGIGCGSLDFYYNPSNPIKLLLEGFVQQGIAVYRVEKPGMGDSTGTQKCLEMDFNYEVAAFDTALLKLKSIKGINPDKIFLYGHSLGAISAPIIASKNKVAGIIAWGGISSTWFEYLLKTDRDQQVILGTDFKEIDTEFRKSLSFTYDFLIKKLTPQQLAKNPEYKEPLKYFVDGKVWYGLHHYRYFHTLNDIDVITTYEKAGCPVLAIAGEHDYHAIDTRWAKEISDAVNYYRPNQGSYLVFPKTTHHYHTVPSMKTYNELRSKGKIDGAYMAQNFNPNISLSVSKWIKKTVK